MQQQLEALRYNLQKTRFENEQQHLTSLDNCFYEEEVVISRLAQLDLILKNLKPVDNTDVFFHEVDRLTYKKPWNRLQLFHRAVKLDEFLTENKQLEHLRQKLHKLISKGKLTTVKHVQYDPKTEKIIKIPCLYVDEDGNIDIKC